MKKVRGPTTCVESTKDEKRQNFFSAVAYFPYHIAFINTPLPPSYLHILQAFKVKANSARNRSKKKKNMFVTNRINYKFPFTVCEHQVVQIFAV